MGGLSTANVLSPMILLQRDFARRILFLADQGTEPLEVVVLRLFINKVWRITIIKAFLEEKI